MFLLLSAIYSGNFVVYIKFLIKLLQVFDSKKLIMKYQGILQLRVKRNCVLLIFPPRNNRGQNNEQFECLFRQQLFIPTVPV
jgi:hypothetical protein